MICGTLGRWELAEDICYKCQLQVDQLRMVFGTHTYRGFLGLLRDCSYIIR